MGAAFSISLWLMLPSHSTEIIPTGPSLAKTFSAASRICSTLRRRNLDFVMAPDYAMPQSYHPGRDGATESLWLNPQHRYNHLRFTQPAPLRLLPPPVRGALQQTLDTGDLSGSDGALTIRINGAHSQTTNGVLYERRF